MCPPAVRFAASPGWRSLAWMTLEKLVLNGAKSPVT
jgi:hypothetical protein